MKSTSIDLPRQDIKRILVIKWSAMGDLAIATSFFEDIRSAFPDAQIDLNTLAIWEHLFAEDPRFNSIICTDIRRQGQKLKKIREWLRIIRKNRYDLIIDLQGNDRTQLMLGILKLSFSGIRWFLGINKRFPYNVTPPKFITNTFKRAQSALQAGGIATNTQHPVIHYPEQHKQKAQQFQQEHKLVPGQYAVFFPGAQAGGELKRWGVDNYAKLANLLAANNVSKSVIIGADQELEVCEAITRANPQHIINLCNQTSILDIIPLCADARFMIANDTGGARIAAVNPIPMVMVFGPTNPDRDLPGGDKIIGLQANEKELPCIKCFKKKCSHHSCMKMVTPEQVMDTLLKIEKN